jgi:hypothetical protein
VDLCARCARDRGLSTLREVHAPLGPPELYDYAALPGELTRVETPSGGVVIYTYVDAYRKASTLTKRTRVISERGTSRRGITAGTTTFAYGGGSNEDTTTVSCACGSAESPTVTTYKFHGTGLTGDFSGWKSGALAEQSILTAAGIVLEQRVFTWLKSEPISSDAVAGDGGMWADDAVYVALPESTTITRGTQSWKTMHEYHTTSFNDFHQPWKTTETGDFMRVSERTFQTGFTTHILGLPATATTQVGGHTATSTWTYDLATGFVTSFVAPKSPLRTYVPRTDGNLASDKNALNHQTTYSDYSWGQARTIQTANRSVTLVVNADGTTASTTADGMTTTVTYDELFRAKKATVTGMTPTVYAYDTVYADRTSSGFEGDEAFAASIIDGFGRPTLNYQSSGTKIHTIYDKCGQLTFQSLPYTSGWVASVGTPGLGVSNEYERRGGRFKAHARRL